MESRKLSFWDSFPLISASSATILFSSLSLSIMKIAEANGGRAYSTGLYFQG